MKIRTLIIDDEPLARKLLRTLLQTSPDFVVVDESAEGLHAIASIKKHRPDLVFLDVQMPGVGGFEVLEALTPEELPLVIFVTAYDKFAVKAFEAHALDYLLKPVDGDRFATTVERAKAQLSRNQENGPTERLLRLMENLPIKRNLMSRIAVKTAGKLVFVNLREIDWIEAAENYVKLHVGCVGHLIRGRMAELEKKLDPEQFFRIHRSTIVNLDRVKEFHPLFKGDGLVILKDGTRLPASRACSHRLQKSLTPEI